MNPNDIRNVALATASVAVVGFATINHLKIRRQEIAKRQVIRKESTLDTIAILNAQKILQARIERGEIRSLAELSERIDDEIAFQKIAIREN